MTDANTSPIETPTSSKLGLFDAVSLIVGIVVGSSIYKAPTTVFGSLNCAWAAMGFWALGGVLSLIGALCYAELATTYPRSGGDYVYISRAFGRFPGFLFGWSHLAGILTGSIGALAFVFADHAVKFFATDSTLAFAFALGAVIVLTLVNVFGLLLGKTAQNLLTILKILGLGGVIVAGISWGLKNGVQWTPSETPDDFSPMWGVALIMVLYAYGGWNDASFVAAEVKERERNLPRALIGGVVAITIVYLLVNLGYLMGLGFDAAKTTKIPAADVIAKPLGERGFQAMLILVMISALGGVNGLILTGSRVHASLGADHPVFAWLGRWNPRFNAPIASLAAQAIVTAGLMTIVGTEWGKSQLDFINAKISDDPLEWERFGGGFDLLVATTAPVFWSFFLLTGASLIVLRITDAQAHRPFRAPLFPLLPLVFCGMCGFMLRESIRWAGTLAMVPLVPLAVGVGLYGISQFMSAHRER